MGHSSTRLTKGVDFVGDIAAFFGLQGGDLGDLIQRIVNGGRINKWAKWKPLRSEALDLPTDTERREAGRTVPSDYSLVYGVRASGLGNVENPWDVHSCSFSYEGPTVISNTNRARALDFVHPTEGNTYGYRSDAYLDFSAVVTWPLGNLVRNKESTMFCNIEYSPHSAELRKEMISINDFLSNGLISYDILNCYPCILISQGQYNFIHALYKGATGSAPATIGSTGETSWRLDTSTPALPSELSNGAATVSVILVSQRVLVQGYDIANWCVFRADGTQAWAAWFLPVIGATGMNVTVSGSASTSTEAVPTSTGGFGTTQFTVGYTWTDDYSGSVDLTIQVEMGTQSGSYIETSTHTKQVSNVQSGAIAFEIFTYNEMGMVPTVGQTIYYRTTIITTIGTSVASNVITGSYVVQNSQI